MTRLGLPPKLPLHLSPTPQNSHNEESGEGVGLASAAPSSLVCGNRYWSAPSEVAHWARGRLSPASKAQGDRILKGTQKKFLQRKSPPKRCLLHLDISPHPPPLDSWLSFTILTPSPFSHLVLPVTWLPCLLLHPFRWPSHHHSTPPCIFPTLPHSLLYFLSNLFPFLIYLLSWFPLSVLSFLPFPKLVRVSTGRDQGRMVIEPNPCLSQKRHQVQAER